MTGPIKPTSGPHTPVQPDSSSLKTPSKTDFRDKISPDIKIQKPTQTGQVKEIERIVSEIRAQRVDSSKVIDMFVEKALTTPSARGLTDQGRAALDQHLRDQFAKDPSLLRLIRDLEEGL